MSGHFAGRFGTPLAAGESAMIESGILNVHQLKKCILFVSAVGTSCLETRTDIPHGRSVFAATARDVTQDGHPDLVVVSDYDDAMGIVVSTLAGDGAGGFREPVHSPLPVSAVPVAMALGDVNADGKLDVVTVDAGPQGTHVLLGVGAGRWSAPAVFATCDEPQAVASGRLDRDAYADVAVACRDDGGAYLDVFHGSASGALIGRTTYRGPAGSVAFDVKLGDVDADGDLDVVTAGIEGGARLRVHRNDGRGVLDPLPAFAGGKRALSLADVNRDGKLDVVAVEDDFVNLLIGSGDNRFTMAASLPLGGRGSSIAAGHIDEGSHPDIVVSRPDEDVVSVFWGTGEPGRWYRQDIATGDEPASVFLSDFDHDSFREVVTANHSTPGTLTVLHQAASSTR